MAPYLLVQGDQDKLVFRIAEPIFGHMSSNLAHAMFGPYHYTSPNFIQLLEPFTRYAVLNMRSCLAHFAWAAKALVTNSSGPDSQVFKCKCTKIHCCCARIEPVSRMHLCDLAMLLLSGTGTNLWATHALPCRKALLEILVPANRLRTNSPAFCGHYRRTETRTNSANQFLCELWISVNLARSNWWTTPLQLRQNVQNMTPC